MKINLIIILTGVLLVCETAGNKVEYTYDEAGNRVEKTI